MTGQGWTTQQLDILVGTDVLEVSSTRRDGSASPWQPVWVVVLDDQVIVRSTDGPEKVWFRNARRRGTGRIRAAGNVYPVRFTDADDRDAPQITDAYQRKYRTSPAYNLNRAASSNSTLRLVPDDNRAL